MNRIVSSWLLLVGLAIAWAAVLAPDIMRRASGARRHDPMGQFSRNLSSLQRQNSGYPQGYGMQRPVSARPLQQRQVQMHRQQRPVSPSLAPMSAARRSAQQQRRQEVLMGLVAAAVLTFLGAISVGGVVVVVHAIVDVALVAYIFALASLAQRGKARSNVTTLYPSGAVQPQMVQAYSQRQRVAR